MKTISLILIACMLAAVVLAFGRGGPSTKRQLKSQHMMHASGRRDMKAAAAKQYASENYDAYMDFDPHRKAWDRYSDAQKRDALTALYNKYVATQILNLGGPNVQALRAAMLPGSTTAELNKAFKGMHEDVNSNLSDVAQRQGVVPRSRY